NNGPSMRRIRRIGDPRGCHSLVERDSLVVERDRPAELSLHERDVKILERTELADTAALVEYHEEKLAFLRIHLARKCADAAVGTMKRTGLSDDASGVEIIVETIFERAFVKPRDGHNIGKIHPITPQLRL